MLLRLVIFSTCTATLLAASTVKISTPSGEIECSTDLTTRLNKKIIACRGIRYAKAPRFKLPVPIDRWNGTYDATADGAVCPQPAVLPLPMSEECLFVNVYTKKLPDNLLFVARPVIIHIHGGSFVIGTGHSGLISPRYILDKDVVLVTFNYRLAALGFTAVNEEVPGNLGLIDQVTVFKWVRRNIRAFGGDPNSVTLYGFSAGACSASLHLTSPMSQGLFQKVFLSSCGLYGGFPLPSLQVSLAQKQAGLVGCVDDPPEAMLDCLRAKPAQEIANTLSQFAEFGTNPAIIWSPVIEQDFEQTRFLKEHPIKSIVNGRFARVPVMAGVTRDEFATQAIQIIQSPTLLQQFNDFFNKWAPVVFCLERNSTRSEEICDAIRLFYFNNEPITAAKTQELGRAFADALLGFGIQRAVSIISDYSQRPVYYYEFTYEKTSKTFAIGHGADQPYLFPSILDPPPTADDVEMIEIMTSYLYNFARTGLDLPIWVKGNYWRPYDTYNQNYLDVGKEPVLRDHLFDDRYNFWEQIFPLSLYS